MTTELVNDPVNHPNHYTAYEGIEIIQLTSQMNFCRGNAVKYVARAGLKSPDHEIEDLEKAVFYIQYEIDRLKGRKTPVCGDGRHFPSLQRVVHCELPPHDYDVPHESEGCKWM